MGRLRYQVACSLDGYIAGPNDEYDWIPEEPSFDFKGLYAEFDVLLMGRRTFELVSGAGHDFNGKRVVVVSKSLGADAPEGIEVISDDLPGRVAELCRSAERDVWLYGGGQLFAGLLALDLVDTVEPAVVPVLLGGGIPFLPAPAVRRRLTLQGHAAYPSGILLLEYRVNRSGS